jgi:preprotein translocase subunit SecE
MARNTKSRTPAKSGANAKGDSASNASSAPARKKTTNPLKFIGEVRQEGRKVTWTGRQEVIVSTIMVFIMSAIMALFFFGVDSFFGWVINMLLGLGG